MKRLPACAFALAFLLSACHTLPGRESDVDAVLTASGLDAQLAWLQQPLETDSTSGPLALVPDDWIQLINSTVADTLQPKSIRDKLRDALKSRLSSRDLLAVQDFYRSPTGRRVVELESGKLDRNLDAAANGNPATLDALTNATGIGKAVSRLAEHGLSDTMDIALRNGCFGQGKLPLSGLLGGVVKKAQMLALRNAVNERLRQRYAALSADEQSTYLNFAQSEVGQKFFNVRSDILNNAAERVGDALNTQLAPRMNEICKAST